MKWRQNEKQSETLALFRTGFIIVVVMNYRVDGEGARGEKTVIVVFA
jgi:hypothetical protein